jgi:RNA ligase (TIGR02306 family)
MASIRRIDDIRPIENADAIECAVVGGWTVVIKKGDFAVGDLAVYCEIDSWIPTELAPFLSKGKEPREYEGVRGERLRTVKLRGQLSQGLLLPLKQSQYDKNTALIDWFTVSHEGNDGCPAVNDGDDVSELLNIRKWEMQVPAQLAGQVKGNFPSLIPKTDQERVQNLVKEIAAAAESGAQFEVTEKLEGSSMTCYLIDGVFGVCSRNLDLKRDEHNTFWKVAIDEGIEEKMRNAPIGDGGFAIQGELIGPGIQGNIYKLSQPEFRVFDIYRVDEGKYVNPANRLKLVEIMGLKHVPVLNVEYVMQHTVEDLLICAEGVSKLNDKQEREGLVFKEMNGGMTFKAISNKYLLGEK